MKRVLRVQHRQACAQRAARDDGHGFVPRGREGGKVLVQVLGKAKQHRPPGGRTVCRTVRDGSRSGGGSAAGGGALVGSIGHRNAGAVPACGAGAGRGLCRGGFGNGAVS